MSRWSPPLRSRNGAVNGGKPDQANVTLDGIDVNNQNSRAAFTSVLRVTLDSVEEFRSTTTNANADQGRSSGAQVALVTRSGTNDLTARSTNTTAIPRPLPTASSTTRPGVQRPALLINVFGGRLGGPIVKNRSFFFMNYEGRRDASSANATRTVPSNELRQGIFRYIDTDRVTPDADAGATSGPRWIRSASAPTRHRSSSSRSIRRPMTWLSAIRSTSSGIGSPPPIRGDQNTYIVKFDHRLDSNGKHQVFVRGNLQNDSSNGTPQFPGLPANSVDLNNSKGMGRGLTSLMKNNLISTFRYGFTRQARSLRACRRRR